MPSHGETSPATAPTHCLSKKWLKIWTLTLQFGNLNLDPTQGWCWALESPKLQAQSAQGATVTQSHSWFCPYGFLLALPPSTGSLGQDSCSTELPGQSNCIRVTKFTWPNPEQQLYLYPLNPSPMQVKIQPNIRAAQALGTPKWTMCCSYKDGSQKNLN